VTDVNPEDVTIKGECEMNEPQAFCNGDSCYYPVWIEEDGTEWSSDPKWEGCEHASDPKAAALHLDNLLANLEQDGSSPFDCAEPATWVTRGRTLCGRHFEEIKFRSRLRFAVEVTDYVCEKPS
jgi:hypothetical protein